MRVCISLLAWSLWPRQFSRAQVMEGSSQVMEWSSAWPKKDGPGYGGSHGMFASPFAPKVAPKGVLWSFTITGTVRTGVVVDAENKMYVAATAQSEDTFAYIYRVDMSGDAPQYEWIESLDTTGSGIFGTPIIGYEKGRRVLYLAATAGGTATNSDNSYIYAFATEPLANETRISKRTDLLWTYPSSVSASYSNVGEIKGSGALHHSGVLLFGTTARGHANYGGSNGVVALKEGTHVWKFDTGEFPVSTDLIVDGPESPSDDDDNCCDSVYFVAATKPSNEAHLYAVDVHNGKKKWDFILNKSDTEMESPQVVGAPSFGAHQDILVGFGNRLYSINKKGGVENWNHEVEGAGKDSGFIAAAAVYDGAYFIGNDQGKFFRFKPFGDNTGVDQLAIPVSLGKIESSPLIYGHKEVMQVDTYGKAEAWKLNGKHPIWTFDYGATIADGRQPAMTSDGKILLGISNAIVAIGGNGGCLAGRSTREASVRGWNANNNSWGSYNGSVPMLLSDDGFCEKCGAGNFSKSAGSPSCERCEPGKWSGKKGATFCYECQQSSWCLGGNECIDGNEGTMCNFCVEGYYLMFTGCVECPKSPFLYTLAAIGGLILFLFIYMHFTRGTKFAYEVNRDDVVAIYVNNGTRCEKCNATFTCGLSGAKSVRVERKVTRVIDDYSIEVAGNFGNKHKIKNTPFWLIKCRMYGDEIRKQGSGRVTIGTATDNASKSQPDTLTGQSDWSGDETGGPGSLINRDLEDETDYGGESGDNRTIVHGKSSSAGSEVIMCASLLMVGYAQSTSVFIQIPIGWPYFAVRVFGMLGQIMQFDIFSLSISPDCDWRWSYTQKWYGAMLFPLFVGIYLALQHYLYSACIAHILIRKQHQNKVVNTACIMMVLLYVFVTAKTIEPYACTEWEDQSRTLNADPDIECTWIRGGAFTNYARMAMLGMFFFIFYGVGIPVALFSMLYKAKINHTMGSVMTKEKFGWIYIRFTSEYYFWEIAIMCRKFLFVLVILLAGTEREMLSWCIAVVLLAAYVQYYYRPYNCFDCLLGRSRRCTHWGAMDQLELGLLLSQLAMLCIGFYLVEHGEDPAVNAGSIGIVEIIMLGSMVIAGLLLFIVIGYLYLKTYLLKNKMRHSGDKVSSTK